MLLITCIAVVLYFLPCWLFVVSRYPQTRLIAVINLVTGWTIVGWLILLAYAIRYCYTSATRSGAISTLDSRSAVRPASATTTSLLNTSVAPSPNDASSDGPAKKSKSDRRVPLVLGVALLIAIIGGFAYSTVMTVSLDNMLTTSNQATFKRFHSWSDSGPDGDNTAAIERAINHLGSGAIGYHFGALVAWDKERHRQAQAAVDQAAINAKAILAKASETPKPILPNVGGTAIVDANRGIPCFDTRDGLEDVDARQTLESSEHYNNMFDGLQIRFLEIDAGGVYHVQWLYGGSTRDQPECWIGLGAEHFWGDQFRFTKIASS